MYAQQAVESYEGVVTVDNSGSSANSIPRTNAQRVIRHRILLLALRNCIMVHRDDMNVLMIDAPYMLPGFYDPYLETSLYANTGLTKKYHDCVIDD